MSGDTNCRHPGYLLKDDKLVCSACGEPSPRAVYDPATRSFIPIGKQEIHCPRCGFPVQATKESKVAARTEDKMADMPENKGRTKIAKK